jgi:hypothetical protein
MKGVYSLDDKGSMTLNVSLVDLIYDQSKRVARTRELDGVLLSSIITLHYHFN